MSQTTPNSTTISALKSQSNKEGTVVEDYNNLLSLLEQMQELSRQADKHKRMGKVCWAKYFQAKKEVKVMRQRLALPENDTLDLTKDLAEEFQNA
jgi:hypothetical protein